MEKEKLWGDWKQGMSFKRKVKMTIEEEKEEMKVWLELEGKDNKQGFLLASPKISKVLDIEKLKNMSAPTIQYRVYLLSDHNHSHSVLFVSLKDIYYNKKIN